MWLIFKHRKLKQKQQDLFLLFFLRHSIIFIN